MTVLPRRLQEGLVERLPYGFPVCTAVAVIVQMRASEHLCAQHLPLRDSSQWPKLLGAWGPGICPGFSLSDSGSVSPSIS